MKSLLLAKVVLRFEFLHMWPEAPEAVGFLANLHRHEMYLSVGIEQFNDDRDIEYILAKRDLSQWVEVAKNFWPERTSCEMIAQFVADYLTARYNLNKTPRKLMIEVTEDGENGAILILEP